MAILATPAAVYAETEMVVVYAQVPSDWEAPHAWAWGPRGDAFPSWPGGAMTPDPNNPGWYFIHIPADKTGGLINANEGSVQTSDFAFEGVPIWVTVSEDGEFEVTTEQQTSGNLPAFVGQGMAVVYAYVPSDWENPGVWAWGPRGDAFPSWPGGEMIPDANNPGWYFIHIPADKTGALINANEGSVQISDFPFTGNNVWVTVNAGDDFSYTTDAQTSGNLPIYVGQGMSIVYAYVPSDWENPGIWAWGPRGDAFPSWPGGAMTADPDNPGWYFAHIPSDKTGALINANDGSVQTSDFPFTGMNVWVTVNAGDDFSYTTDQQTSGNLLPVYADSDAPAGEDFAIIDAVPVFAYVPSDWENPGIWAWGPRGNAFDEWPGELMIADPDNPGWFFLHLPADKTGVIINASDGTVQTENLTFEGVPIWVTVLGDEAFEYTTEQLTEGPIPVADPFVIGEVADDRDLPDVGTIYVRAIVPAAWADPGVWAWNDHDGYGSVFPGWPGEPFADMDSEWHIMSLPAWVDHIIINAISGGVQTIDIEVEPGRDIWIAILDADGGFYLAYEEFNPDDAEAEVVLAERQEVVEFGAPPEPAPTPEPEPVVEDESTNTVIIIIIIVVVVVVLAAGVVAILVIMKKKKK